MLRGFAILLTALLFLSACTTGPKRPVPEPTPEVPADVTIRLLSDPDDVMEAKLDPVIAAFQEQFPHIKVERVALAGGGDYRERFRAMAEGRVDVVPVDGWDDDHTPVAQPLDHYIQKSGFDTAPYGPEFGQHRVNGRVYYLPYAIMPIGIGGRADLLDAAGVTLPQGGWTWDDLRSLARKLTGPVGGESVYGVDGAYMGEQLVRVWLDGRAGKPGWQATDQDLQDALGFAAALVRLDKSLSPPPVRAWQMNMQDPPVEPLIFQGRAVLSFMLYAEGVYEQMGLPFELRFAPMPGHPGRKPASLAHVRCMAVASGSKVADAAWEFIRFATGPAGAKRLAETGTLPMYMTEETKAAWMARKPAPPPFTEAFFGTSWYFFGENWQRSETTIDGPMYQILNRMSNRVLAQGMAPAEAIRLFREEAKAVEAAFRPR